MDLIFLEDLEFLISLLIELSFIKGTSPYNISNISEFFKHIFLLNKQHLLYLLDLFCKTIVHLLNFFLKI